MSETQKPSSPSTRNRLTLKAFINENDKLFTAIGVVGALGAFFTTLKNGEILAFLCFAMLLVLDLELLTSLLEIKGASETLIAFQILFQFFVAFIEFYLVQTYLTYVIYIFPAVIPIAGIWLSFPLTRKLKSRKIALIVSLALMIILYLAYFVYVIDVLHIVKL